MRLSVVIITKNEEENLARTLRSVQPLVADGQGEIIVVDSGSTDRTGEIAREFGAKVFVEEWKGFAAQKNSAIAKASGDWVLSLDADEEVSAELAHGILDWLSDGAADGRYREFEASAREGRVLKGIWHAFKVPRRNYFLGRWIKHGGFYPDAKVRFFWRGVAHFEERVVHESVAYKGASLTFKGDILHHAYPTLEGYIEHMNRYSSLGAEIAVEKGQTSRSWVVFFFNTFVRPRWTFIWNYFFRLGFLDGREGYLLHFYHAVYVSWKYAKAWERSRSSRKS